MQNHLTASDRVALMLGRLIFQAENLSDQVKSQAALIAQLGEKNKDKSVPTMPGENPPSNSESELTDALGR